MKDLVEFIARALVSQPELVEVRSGGQDGDAEVLELQVAADDRGKVIGKKGRTAHAMRSLLQAASPAGKSYTLEIID